MCRRATFPSISTSITTATSTTSYNLNDWGCRTIWLHADPVLDDRRPGAERGAHRNRQSRHRGGRQLQREHAVRRPYTAGAQTPAIAANGSTSECHADRQSLQCGTDDTVRRHCAWCIEHGLRADAQPAAHLLRRQWRRRSAADGAGRHRRLSGELQRRRGLVAASRWARPGHPAWGINYGSYAFNSAIQLQELQYGSGGSAACPGSSASGRWAAAQRSR